MPKTRESDEDFNAKRKREGQAHARGAKDSYQAYCPRSGCMFTGAAGSLSAALQDAVLHDHRRHQ